MTLLFLRALAEDGDHPSEEKRRGCSNNEGGSRCKAAYCGVEVEEGKSENQESSEI